MPKLLLSHKWLWLILVLAFGVRLYRIDNPIADWHSFRQADTASVTREYVKNGVDILRPHYQDLSNIQSGKDNLEGYRMVEFPFINAGTAVLIRATGAPLDLTSRLVTVGFSLGALISLYFLVKQESGQRLALLTAFIFAVLPYSVFYSRAVLPESAMLFFFLLSLGTFARWLRHKKWQFYLISLTALSLALLLKPFVGFLAPVYLLLSIKYFGKKIIFQWPLLVYGALAVVPFIAWRDWITQFPTGIPANGWLFNSNGIRLRPAWFRWIFLERITVLIGGYVGSLLLAANLVNLKKDHWLYGAWWVGLLAYFVIIATGNVQHDYYQVLAIPLLCISFARGLLIIYDLILKRSSPKLALFICTGLLVLMLVLAWQQVKGFFNVNHWEYVEAGQAVDKLVPLDAKVIAPAFGDTHFLYQTNRTGWPIGFEIEDKITKGATHYVTTSNDDEARELGAKYKTLFSSDRYTIIDLTQPLP